MTSPSTQFIYITVLPVARLRKWLILMANKWLMLKHFKFQNEKNKHETNKKVPVIIVLKLKLLPPSH